MKWQPFPMIRIAGVFTGGVLLGIYQADFIPFPFVISIIALLIVLFLVIKIFSKENRLAIYSGALGLTLIFFLGYSRLLLFTESRNENNISKVTEPIESYEAVVRSVPEEKAKSWKIEMEVIQAKSGEWKPVTGRLLLYLSKKDNLGVDWKYGDKVLIKGRPQELSSPANPYEFDFKRFLSFKNISHQQFASVHDVKLVERSTSKGFIYYSHEARAWCMKRLNAFVHGDDERGIAIALVLGVTDGVDNDLQNAYAASGAMHVLAVSGMHVGIIYAIILFLFKPIDKFRHSKWVVAAISLICLWSFSFITGNSPSVLRAVTMFSFIALARPFSKRTNIYNTLAASVLVLLIYNPYLIMSVGFQLSYLAVLGIVYLQRPIYQFWEIENSIGDWIWKITCVSIAAQASTFALGLLYFHQFPTYFLISNLFVIPLSTLVLLGGIFLLSVNFIAPLAEMVGVGLEWLIQALNWTVFRTESLPLSLINNIHITIFQCWVLMGMLMSLALLFQMKSKWWLYSSFVLTIVFAICQWLHFVNDVDQKQMIVYSINDRQAIEFIEGGRSFFVADSLLWKDQERTRFHMGPNRLDHGVASIEARAPFESTDNGLRIFRWQGKTLAILNSKKALPYNSDFDCLIVARNSLLRTQLPLLKAKQIVFDGTNSRRYVEAMALMANRNHVRVHSVLKDGAFIIQQQ